MTQTIDHSHRLRADLDRTLVRAILEHPHEYPWKLQGTGLLGLRLDDQRAHRLHVWAPDLAVGPTVIHDHPYDFVSRIIAGELTNVRYEEDPAGVTYRRERYAPADEDDRVADTVRLSATEATYREGDEYAQVAHGLHDSRQLPGTVTALTMTWREPERLTVCRPDGAPWISGAARPATPEEVDGITRAALAWF